MRRMGGGGGGGGGGAYNAVLLALLLLSVISFAAVRPKRPWVDEAGSDSGARLGLAPPSVCCCSAHAWLRRGRALTRLAVTAGHSEADVRAAAAAVAAALAHVAPAAPCPKPRPCS